MDQNNATPIDETTESPDFDSGFRSQLHTLFAWRRDVRRFLDTPLPAGLLEKLTAVAGFAPSVGLSEPWRFVTVDDPARRVEVRKNFEACNARALADQSADRVARYARLKLAGLEDAPAHLAVFADRNTIQGHNLGRHTMPEMIDYSAVTAIHTVWLAARAEGIGMGWVSILDPTEIATILSVPSEWKFIGYFCLGYPAAEDDTPELEREGWERRRDTASHLIRR